MLKTKLGFITQYELVRSYKANLNLVILLRNTSRTGTLRNYKYKKQIEYNE